VNNVTIYKVDILPDKVPDVFRSGMTATVNIVESAKENVLTLPLAAIRRDKDGAYALASKGKGQKPEKRKIVLGVSDEKSSEIVSGLTPEDTVLMFSQKYKAASGKAGTNPLMPAMRRR
jgi:macrolide-specific efflux system membrane fusion protein